MSAQAPRPRPLNADGGMVANAWFMQNFADILGRPVARAAMAETTARGAALLAGLSAGVYPSLDVLAGSAGRRGPGLRAAHEHWMSARRATPAGAPPSRACLTAAWQLLFEYVYKFPPPRSPPRVGGEGEQFAASHVYFFHFPLAGRVGRPEAGESVGSD